MKQQKLTAESLGFKNLTEKQDSEPTYTLTDYSSVSPGYVFYLLFNTSGYWQMWAASDKLGIFYVISFSENYTVSHLLQHCEKEETSAYMKLLIKHINKVIRVEKLTTIGI